MAQSDNRKQIAELKALRDKLNTADRKGDYDIVAEACLEIIALDKRAKALKILVFLYHKDLAEAYLKIHEYEKAVDSLKTAREGVLHHRATEKLKFPEDWLASLDEIERRLVKAENLYEKQKENLRRKGKDA